jgi:hypothetical protein
MCGPFQTDRDVTEFGNHFEVSPGPAVTEIIQTVLNRLSKREAADLWQLFST